MPASSHRSVASGLTVLAIQGAGTQASAAGLWSSPVISMKSVVSQLPNTLGVAYPDPGGAPVAGNCRQGVFNSKPLRVLDRSKPGTETLVGVSKYFLENVSTFYNFYVGRYAIKGRHATNDTVTEGYDVVMDE